MAPPETRNPAAERKNGCSFKSRNKNPKAVDECKLQFKCCGRRDREDKSAFHVTHFYMSAYFLYCSKSIPNIIEANSKPYKPRSNCTHGFTSMKLPEKMNATFPSRQNDDSNFFFNSNTRDLEFSSSHNHLYRIIVSRLYDWSQGSLNETREPTHDRVHVPTTGLRLLSLGTTYFSPVETTLTNTDGGGVRGLCSLLVLDRLMHEIKLLELANQPESSDWPRLPCRYFDLCGGTSTGG